MDHLAQTILPITAKTAEAFACCADQLCLFLKSNQDVQKSDLVATLGRGRRHFPDVRGVAQLHDNYRFQLFRGEVMRRFETVNASENLIWCFPGQGMALDWRVLEELCRYPVFADNFDDMLARFKALLGQRLFEEKISAFLPTGSGMTPKTQGRGTMFDQIVVFSLEVALGRLWLSHGIRPVGVIGHSVGEYPAAVFAGILTQEDATALVALRAREMDGIAESGFMCQVRATPEVLHDILRNTDLDIACRNAPGQTVVSGHEEKFELLTDLCATAGIDFRRLDVAGAFHSSLMAPAADSLSQAGYHLKKTNSDLALYQTCQCGLLPVEGLAYWSAQLRGTVDFVAAVETVLNTVDRPIFQEIGLGRTLGGFACSIAEAHGVADCAVISGLRGDRDGVPATIANLFSAGYRVAWNRLNGTETGKIVPLPGYPFQKTPIKSKTGTGQSGGSSDVSLPTLGNASPLKVQFFDISPSQTDWLRGHRVNDAFVVPGAGMLAMMLDFAASAGCRSDLHLHDVVFEAPISMNRTDETCRIGLQIESGPSPRIALYARAEGATGWTRNAVAVIRNQADWPAPPDVGANIPSSQLGMELYARFSELGLEYDSDYRRIETLTAATIGSRAVFTGLENSAGLTPLATALDTMLQVSDWAQGVDTNETVLLPASIGRVSLNCRSDAASAGEIVVDGHKHSTTVMFDSAGNRICSLSDIRFSSDTLPDVAPPILVPRWEELGDRVDLRTPREVLEDAVSISEALIAAPKARAEIDVFSDQIGRLEAMVLQRMRSRISDEDLKRLANLTYPMPDAGSASIVRRRQRALAALAQGAMDVRDSGSLQDDLPLVSHEFDLAAAAVDLLDNYLKGKMTGEEILFEGARSDILRAYYQNSFILKRANDAVMRIIGNRAAGLTTGHIRILEVGGGTGATSEGVLNALKQIPNLSIDYLFTDVSSGLLQAAEARFGHIHGFRTTRLDLNDPTAYTRIDGKFDIVLGVDVVHATRNIRTTVEHIAAKTASNGLFVMVEDTEKLAWIDLVFGMLDGWWDFDDDRKDHPLLAFGKWAELLGERFGKVRGVDLCSGGECPVVAREGLFLCSAPSVETVSLETLRIDRAFLKGYDPAVLRDSLADWAAAGTHDIVTIADFDRLGDPGQIKTYARVCIDIAKFANEQADGRRVILCSRSKSMPVAGGLDAGLARVAASEGLNATILALQVGDLTDGIIQSSVEQFLQYRGTHLNGRVSNGVLSVPTLTAAESAEFEAQQHNDALVIFGGESEIALSIARNWARAGQQRIVLAGRNVPREKTLSALAALEKMGASASYEICDVTDYVAVTALADKVAGCDRPLVLNLAGRLIDSTLHQLQPDDLETVMDPKVLGSWNIMQAFSGRPGDLILFSSTTSYLGNGGQTAHAMACAYLEELACAGDLCGLDVKSIAWGPWNSLGITARMGLNSLLANDGETALSTRAGLKSLEFSRQLNTPVIVAANLTSSRLQRRAWFRAMFPLELPAEDFRAGDTEAKLMFAAAGDTPVQSVVGQVLGISSDDLDPALSLEESGVDSLQQIEIRLGLEELSGAHVPLSLLTESGTLAQLERAFAQTVLQRPVGAAEDQPAKLDRLFGPRPKVFFFEGIFGCVGCEGGLLDVVGEAVDVIALASGHEAEPDIVSAAAKLADRIEDHAPEGDITLMGHSFGVMLAYSVAVELEARGRSVAHFYALDGLLVPALSPHHAARLGDGDFEALLRASRQGDHLEIAVNSESAVIGAFKRVFRNNCRLAASNQALISVEFPVTLVLPELDNVSGVTRDLFLENMERIRNAVRGTTSVRITVINSPGDHFSMIRQPFIKSTGEALMAQISRRHVTKLT